MSEFATGGLISMPQSGDQIPAFLSSGCDYVIPRRSEMAPSTSEVRVKIKPELSEEFEALLGTATQNTLAKLDAGAALAYAIYHTPKAQIEAFFGAMPQSVVKAYAKACDAYGIGFHGLNDVTVAESLAPLLRLADDEVQP